MIDMYKGTNTTLDEVDVWNLSPKMQSRPIFIKFSSIESVAFCLCVTSENLLTTLTRQIRYATSSAVCSQLARPPVGLTNVTFRLYSSAHRLDFILTLVSVVFNYASPFFLK
jgi:hypothetical protein